MLSRYLVIVFLVVSFCVSFFVEVTAGGNDYSSELISDIQYYRSSGELAFDSVKNLSEGDFHELNNQIIKTSENFWLRIVLNNSVAIDDEYFIHFYGHLDEVNLFFENNKGEWIERQSGVMVPEDLKTVKGFIKDKVPFSLTEGEQTILYLKIKNTIEKDLDVSRIRIVDSKSFNHSLIHTKEIQSFFLGIVAVLCFFNLILYSFTRTRIYLYYLFYVAFSSLYFIHYFQYFESGFFVNHPEINVYFFFSITLIQAIYCWFLFESLKIEASKKLLLKMKKYALTVSGIVPVTIVVALFRFRTGVLISDILSTVNSLLIIGIVFFLFRKVSNTVKIILTGSLFMVASGFLAILFNFKNEVPVHIYLFQAGFFIELIFFTVAINFMYQNERMAKLKTEIRNRVLENEKLVKEREAQKLREEVHLKERDLTTKAFAITQKEMLIKNVTAQLEKQVQNNAVEVKDIKEVILDLSSKMNDNYWEEFETHFIQVHPDFYKLLNKKYPGLTTTERKLCAFIKLNLTTKEIAGITKRNPESIHMTRSRLRKKMGLDKSENLENVINSVG